MNILIGIPSKDNIDIECASCDGGLRDGTALLFLATVPSGAESKKCCYVESSFVLSFHNIFAVYVYICICVYF